MYMTWYDVGILVPNDFLERLCGKKDAKVKKVNKGFKYNSYPFGTDLNLVSILGPWGRWRRRVSLHPMLLVGESGPVAKTVVVKSVKLLQQKAQFPGASVEQSRQCGTANLLKPSCCVGAMFCFLPRSTFGMRCEVTFFYSPFLYHLIRSSVLMVSWCHGQLRQTVSMANHSNPCLEPCGTCSLCALSDSCVLSWTANPVPTLKLLAVDILLDWTVEKRVTNMIHLLGGGFKYFLFSPLFGEMIQFD